jgi:hypothetical protein
MSGKVDVSIHLDSILPGRAILSVGRLGTVGALHSDGWHTYPSDRTPAYIPTPQQVSALAMVLAAFTEPPQPARSL